VVATFVMVDAFKEIQLEKKDRNKIKETQVMNDLLKIARWEDNKLELLKPIEFNIGREDDEEEQEERSRGWSFGK